jgi:antitoxin (DNA-binding transcriptional repressor) of toxin-antitoxin stability system
LTSGAFRQYGHQEKTIFRGAVMDDALQVSASEFKARCLAIFRDLEARRIGRVLVTRRGRPVAELVPPRTRLATLWGAHRGSVEVASLAPSADVVSARSAKGIDLTAPVLDESLDAAAGVLHR